MWWMTVAADGCRDYLVKRIPSVLLPSGQHRYSIGRTHTHTQKTERVGQRSIHTFVFEYYTATIVIKR